MVPMILKKTNINKNDVPILTVEKPPHIPYPKYKKAVYIRQNSYLGTTTLFIIRKKILYGG